MIRRAFGSDRQTLTVDMKDHVKTIHNGLILLLKAKCKSFLLILTQTYLKQTYLFISRDASFEENRISSELY